MDSFQEDSYFTDPSRRSPNSAGGRREEAEPGAGTASKASVSSLPPKVQANYGMGVSMGEPSCLVATGTKKAPDRPHLALCRLPPFLNSTFRCPPQMAAESSDSTWMSRALHVCSATRV